jgi:diketogulonate reductase-like aldo/keto reductase
MRRHLFGSTGRRIPVIGQGTWNIELGDHAAAIEALRRGTDLGMTHIDTAEMYGAGEAERLVGAAIAGRRDEIFLVSKVLPENASFEGTMAACEGSLKRLRTDRLDCYLLHWRGAQPLQDTVTAFERLFAAGKILSWGVSNFDVTDLEDALALVGEGHIACNQVLYHLQQRSIELSVLPWCAEHDVALVGYSPFGHGRFPGPHTKGGRVLEEIAIDHRVTAHQVALAFLVRLSLLFTIPKAATPAHAEKNARAGDVQLSQAEMARIEEAFPRPHHVRPLPVL